MTIGALKNRQYNIQARYILFILFIINGVSGKSQDLSKISFNNPFTISGYLNFDQMLANSYGQSQDYTRDPYSFFINGGLNFSYNEFSLPLNFSYTNQNLGFSHPFTFNQFGIKPSYKWLQVYVGYNSFSFSPYTFNGHQFNGIGISANPPDFPASFSVIYGRLLKANQWDGDNAIPSYKRMGIGFNSNVALSIVDFGVSFLYSWDDENSIPLLPDSLGITPKENLTVSFSGGVKPFSGTAFNVYVGNSVLTDDKFSAISGENRFWAGLFPDRTSTSSYWAYKTDLNYSVAFGSVGLAFESIQPDYQTLGAYYFSNDLQNITVNAMGRLLEGKVNLNGNIGVQRDNLKNQKLFGNQRIVGSLSANVTAGEGINANLFHI